MASIARGGPSIILPAFLESWAKFIAPSFPRERQSPYIVLQSPYIFWQSPFGLWQSPYSFWQSPYILWQSPYIFWQSPEL